MYKIANQVLDAYDDIHWTYLSKVAQERPQTNLMSPEEVSKIADDDFALCMITKEAQKLRRFPVDCEDNTWLSNRYFEETHHKLAEQAVPVAAHFIKQACERFGIEPSNAVEKLAGKADHNVVFHVDEVKPLTTDTTIRLEKFAEVDKITDNYTHAQYIFATPTHVKVACEYFEQKHDKMDVDTRHKYAAAIQIRANELGMGPQKGSVAKYASDSYGGMVDAHIASRRRLLDGSPFLDELNKLASARRQFTPGQFAQVLSGFDKKAGLSRHYDGYLTNPYEATFAAQPDQDQGYRWIDKKGSRTLTEEEIRKVIKEQSPKLAEYFGKQTAEEMKTNPLAIFESLPNDAKEIIANISDGSL